MTDFAENRVWQAVRRLTRQDVWDAGADENGTANELFKSLVERTAWLKLRAGVVGEWDMTGVLEPSAPSAVSNGTVADLIEGYYTLTPTPELPAMSFAACSSTAALLPASGTRTAHIVMPAETEGDTWHSVACALTSVDVTAATPIAEFTHAAILQVLAPSMRPLNDGDHAQLQVMTPGGSITVHLTFTDGAPVAGDEIHFSIDLATGALSVQVNAGTVQEVLASYDTSEFGGAARVLQGVYFYDVGVFAAGGLDFSFGTWQSLSEATPPEGHADGARYLVSQPGTFGGTTTYAGDIVEFYNNASQILTTPGPARLDAIAALMAPSALSVALSRHTINDVAGSAPPLVLEGFVVLVSGGSGDWAEWADGDLAVYTGSTWTRIPKADVQGIPFRFLPADSAATRADVWISQNPLVADEPIDSGLQAGAFGTAAVTEIALRALGWVMRVEGSHAVRSVVVGDVPNTMTGTPLPLDGAELVIFDVSGGDLVTPLLLSPEGIWSAALRGAQVRVVIRCGGAAVVRIIGNELFWVLTSGQTRVFDVITTYYGLEFVEVPVAAKWVAVTDPELSSDWVNVGGGEQAFSWRRQADKMEVRGAITAGTAAAIWGIPGGCRPVADLRLPCQVEDGVGDPVFGQLTVTAGGTLQLAHPETLSGHTVRLNVSWAVDGA